MVDSQGWIGETFARMEEEIDELRAEMSHNFNQLNGKIDLILQHLTGDPPKSPFGRGDRLEALAEKLLEELQETKQITDSNARSIEALTEETKTYQKEAQIDRARLYQAMADLARAQASYYERLEGQDEQIRILSRRQGEIVEILKLLTSQRI